MRKLMDGINVEVAFVGKRDRYGRRAAHVLIPTGGGTQDGGPVWLQERMVAAGLARFDPVRERTKCAVRLLAAELSARRSRRGLWAFAAYRVRDAAKPRDLLKLQSTFQLVRGRVMSAKSVRGRVYLNFGDNYRRDFTATISKSQMKYFARGAVRPLELEGRDIIVRGWIESFGGPSIEIRHTSQIEVVRPGSPDQLSSSGRGPTISGKAAVGDGRVPGALGGPIDPRAENNERPDRNRPGALEL